MNIFFNPSILINNKNKIYLKAQKSFSIIIILLNNLGLSSKMLSYYILNNICMYIYSFILIFFR